VRFWLNRWNGLAPNSMLQMPDTLPELETMFVLLADERKSWFTREPSVFLNSIPYQLLNGEQSEQTLSELVLHVLNHAVHHRAQVVHFP